MKQFSAVGFVQILLAMTTEAEPEPEVEPPQPPLDQKKAIFLQQDLYKYCSQWPPQPNPKPKPNPKSNPPQPPLDQKKQFSAAGFAQILLAMPTEAEPEVEPPNPPSTKKNNFLH